MSDKSQFSGISKPLAPQDPTRNVVASRTVPVNRVSAVNAGVRDTNPHHTWGNRLESYQHSNTGGYKPGSPVITQTGPARQAVNHSHQVTRMCLHSNMGTSRKAHAFPGRRK
jgi:hypothetical protein